jgi:MFS family permease
LVLRGCVGVWSARVGSASLIPIQAYEVLQSEQQVSFLYTTLGVLALCTTLLIPALTRTLARRWVYTLGALALIAAAALFLTATLASQAAGMLLRVFGTACLNVTLNLYLMDSIPRQQFVRTESLRMTLGTIAWTAGPGLGVWLYSEFGLLAAHGWSAAWASLLIAVFWCFRLSDDPGIRPARSAPINPLRNIGSFASQPRLRLAWLIAFGRSCFWSTYFIYVPLLMVVAGEGKLAGGYVVSAGNVMLASSLLWGRWGERLGVRKVLTASFAALAAACVAAGLAGTGAPWLAAAALLLASFFATGLDALGGVPFLRAVRQHQRAQMTAVYRTYLDTSELLPPLLYGLLLGFFGLGLVFLAFGLFALGCAAVCWRYLPRSM